MSAYYNEHDPKAAAWLRELIKEGHIAPGDVDERSITEIQPHELTRYTQCHFFAGIGGWSLALRLAGWSDDKPAWSGSCPCQPFSIAGIGAGTDDERHLWPEFFRLIKACSPKTIFGEQVSSSEVIGSKPEAAFVDAVQRGDFAKANKLAKRLARNPSFSYTPRWLDGVCADLESAHYSCGAADVPAAGVGAPHIRERLWWMAVANGGDASAEGLQRGGQYRQQQEDGGACGLSDSQREGLEGLAGNGDDRNEPGRLGAEQTRPIAESGRASEQRMEHAEGDGREQRRAESSRRRSAVGCGWSDFDIIPCRDGKTRRIESGTFPLAHGVPNRVGLLRGYGNAIVPQLASEFIQACEEAIAMT